MDAIEILGVRYIKADDAARLTGYATDYIGQLSRGGKIDGRRIGRVWYVNETEVVAHKRNNSRSNKQRTQRALRKDIAAGQINHVYFDPSRTSMPEYRTRLLNADIKYEEDERPLSPVLEKMDTLSPAIQEEPEQKEAEEVPPPSDVAEEEALSVPITRLEDEKEEGPGYVFDNSAVILSERAHTTQTSPRMRASKREKERLAYIPRSQVAIVPQGRPSFALTRPFVTALTPLVLALCFAFSFAGVFFEHVVVYEKGKTLTSAPVYQESYAMRGLSSVIQGLPKNSDALFEAIEDLRPF